MGGRGAFSGGSSAGGVNVKNSTSLVSEREHRRGEVDQTLTALRRVHDAYGVDVEDAHVVTLGKKDAGVLAYYNAAGNLAVNTTYFNSAKMDKVYDDCVKQKFHPPRGKKSGMEAVVAHEMGHRLTDQAGVKAGYGSWAVDRVSKDIVTKAAKKMGYGSQVKKFREKISGYGSESNAEAVAEAFADVYCNGRKASRGSRAIVNELNTYFGGKGL